MPKTADRLLAQVRRFIPPLGPEMHKGQAGRVGVVGGSKDYCGAPYFSAMSSMRLGADLAHVICDPDAGNAIKTYSPDLIVHRIITPDSVKSSLRKELEGLLSRLHILVVGPGLGREDYMQSAARMAISIAREQDKYIVIDADGLYLVSQDPDVIKGYKRAILTPNVVEFGRLCEVMDVDQKGEKEKLAYNLASKFGNVTILQKGATDIISNGTRDPFIVDAEGGYKRCGGQGDILSGVTGCMLAWCKTYEEGTAKDEKDAIPLEDLPLLAAYGASTITRYCSKQAFKRCNRSMQTSDMMEEVGKAYDHYFGMQDAKM